MSEKLLNKRTAEVYTRAVNVVITNELGMTPQIRFNLEEAVINPDGTQEGMGFKGQALIGEMTDPNESFLLVNPLDGTPLGGEGTAAQMQTLITSYFYYLSEKNQYEKLAEAVTQAGTQVEYYTARVAMADGAINEANEERGQLLAQDPPADTAEVDQRLTDIAAEKLEAETKLSEAQVTKTNAETALAEFIASASHTFGS